MAEETKPAEGSRAPAAPGAAAHAPVAGSGPANKSGNAAAASGAVASVPLFGGNRGGKRRRDGLVPGSQEALEADRKTDKERKQKIRESAHRLAPQPALPSVLPSNADSGAALVNGEGIPAAVAPVEQPPVLWEPGLLTDVVAEGVEWSEKRRIQKFREAAQAAQLPEALVRKITSDAQYVPAFKVTAIKRGPPAIAKLLNRLGISAEYSDEGLFLFSVAALCYQGWRLESELQEMIEQHKAAAASKPAPAPAKP